MLPFIHRTIEEYCPNLEELTLADLFAGTGIVARSFRGKVRSVIANDLELYSKIIASAYLCTEVPDDIPERIHELNALPGYNGFIYEEYSEGGRAGRQYFSRDNGRRIDAVRQRISQWKSGRDISDNTETILLAALLEAADKIANVASVYGAFLKKIKASAQKLLTLNIPIIPADNTETTVWQEDTNMLIREISGDILYLDPPYNTRQYGANYHLLNTIARYDEFVPGGITGLPPYTRSAYCSRSNVAEVFEDLIRNAQFRYIFLSYNNEGLLPPQIIRHIMSAYGSYTIHHTEYQRFKADKTSARNHKANSTTEFIHVLVKP